MAKRTRPFTTEPAPSARKPYRVFISHATSDKWIAKTICEKIELRGAETFRDDRDIHGGDDIPEEIRRQINLAKEVIVILTPDSVNRQWVTLEIGAAWGRSNKTRIIILMCHVAVDPIPDLIKSKKALHLNEIDQYLADLSERVKDYHEKTS